MSPDFSAGSAFDPNHALDLTFCLAVFVVAGLIVLLVIALRHALGAGSDEERDRAERIFVALLSVLALFLTGLFTAVNALGGAVRRRMARPDKSDLSDGTVSVEEHPLARRADGPPSQGKIGYGDRSRS
ncbi:hypothetical protein ACFXHA_43415 [Nocardia sp. NPDC059240]|uniref:hypothetical protein n=1 Tax=Nocardia sp. NPDC059240 TaxID=3346786 RepID=UPI0036B245C0